METTPRTRLIQTACMLFQTQGYNSTGLNQILQESATPKGSLYHYFPGGKEDLAVAAIGFAGEAVGATLQQHLSMPASLHAVLGAVVQFFMDELAASDFKKGCPVATIALEQASHSAKIQAACAAVYGQWQDGIAALLLAHGVAQADKAAARLMNSLEGALILSRARASTLPLQQLIDDLPLLLPPATPTTPAKPA